MDFFQHMPSLLEQCLEQFRPRRSCFNRSTLCRTALNAPQVEIAQKLLLEEVALARRGAEGWR